MIVIKRSKHAQNYDESKVRNSIIRAFKSCNTEISDFELNEVIKDLNIKNGIRTEDIQSNIEMSLMSHGYYKQAKFFIIWRHINYYDNYLGNKVRFMRNYLSASNAASGSKYDANANVTEKNLATLSGELFKGDVIKLNRYRLYNKIEELYGKELADEYIRMLEDHWMYKHDESSIYPYCVSVTLYPFLLDGFSSIGGISDAPRNLESFCGSFINLMFAIAAQFAGAVASPEFLLYFDYFARKEFGQDYYLHSDEFYKLGPELRQFLNETRQWISTPKELKEFESKYPESSELITDLLSSIDKPLSIFELKRNEDMMSTTSNPIVKLSDGSRTIKGSIIQFFQQVVYSMNQPAAARCFQSIFWNIGYFDSYYFKGMFGEFRFPDGSEPCWESLDWLQKLFMKWFNKERTRKVLTFPVESMALLTDGSGDVMDKEYGDFTAEMYSEGHSFFTYMSDSPDALASCCRLRNELQDNTFSYSLGAGGVATGSKSVMTLNINRLVQIAVQNKKNYVEFLREQLLKVHKFQIAFNELLVEFYKQGALPVYTAGFISLNKQYLTIGVNGVVEAAEFLGIPVKPCNEYKDFIQSILTVFYEENKKARTKDLMWNTEFVPAENLGVKFYNWDLKDGFKVPTNRNCYNSYFYASEDESLTIMDKFRLHGKEYTQFLDGGVAAHINLDEHLSKPQYRQLIKAAVKYGTSYFTFNIPNTVCRDCGHIDKRYLDKCPKCGSTNVDYATRIIGYLKLVSNFSEARQSEAGKRYYANGSNILSEQNYLLYFSDINYYMALTLCDHFMNPDESYQEFKNRLKVIDDDGVKVTIIESDGSEQTYEWINNDNSIIKCI